VQPWVKPPVRRFQRPLVRPVPFESTPSRSLRSFLRAKAPFEALRCRPNAWRRVDLLFPCLVLDLSSVQTPSTPPSLAAAPPKRLIETTVFSHRDLRDLGSRSRGSPCDLLWVGFEQAGPGVTQDRSEVEGTGRPRGGWARRKDFRTFPSHAVLLNSLDRGFIGSKPRNSCDFDR